MTLAVGWPGHRRRKLAVGLNKWPVSRAAGNVTLPAIQIADFSARSTIRNPPAALIDAAVSDHPTGAATALQLSTSGTTAYYVDPAVGLTSPVDVRKGYIQIPFKAVSQCERIGIWSIELHSAGTPAAPTGNYHQIDPFGEGPSALKQILTSKANGAAPGRWQVFAAHANDFQAVGSGADLSAVRFARLRIRGTSGYTCIIQFGAIRLQPAALRKAACIIYFDDGHTSAYTDAFPLFQAKGWRACFNLGAMAQTLDVPGRMSTAQVKALVAAGWQMHAQAFTDETLATVAGMTAAQRDLEMKKQREWAILNRIADLRHGSYYSQVTQAELAVLDMFKANFRSVRGYFSARGANPPMLFGESYPWADPLLVRSMAGDHTLEQLQAHCLQAIANKGVAAFTFHASIANLAELLDWLDARRGLIEVLTEQQLHERFHGPEAAFTADELGGALAGWYDAEDAATLSLSGNLVNSIRDKRTGLVLSQTLTASKPGIGSGVINGRPALTTDGVDDHLFYAGASTYPSGSSPSEIWALIRNDLQPLTQLSIAFSYGADSGNVSRRLGASTMTGGSRAMGITGTGGSNVQAGGPTSLSPFAGARIVRSVHGADQTTTYDNGLIGSTLSAVPATANERIAIGSGNRVTNMWVGAINSIYIINPLHPNWHIVNQAKLLMMLKERGGIA